jgi:hypothetical protein
VRHKSRARYLLGITGFLIEDANLLKWNGTEFSRKRSHRPPGISEMEPVGAQPGAV